MYIRAQNTRFETINSADMTALGGGSRLVWPVFEGQVRDNSHADPAQSVPVPVSRFWKINLMTVVDQFQTYVILRAVSDKSGERASRKIAMLSRPSSFLCRDANFRTSWHPKLRRRTSLRSGFRWQDWQDWQAQGGRDA
jgi:hypothetical protein